MTEWIQVRTTLPDHDKARELARWAIESGWAACAQVSGPIESVYRWKGAVECGEEWTLLLKTHRSRWHGLVEAIQAKHPYECPELIAESLAEVSDGYAVWLAEQVPPEMGS